MEVSGFSGLSKKWSETETGGTGWYVLKVLQSENNSTY
jgi:hypothetical protein